MILLGIKTENASGSSTDLYGYGGFKNSLIFAI